MKRTTDYEQSLHLRHEANVVFGGKSRSSNLITSLFKYFLKSIPFSVKVFLRKNIGSFNYTWGTIFLAAVWSRFIMDGYLDLHEFAFPDSLFGFVDKNDRFYLILYPLWLIIMLAIQFGHAIINFIPHEFFNENVFTEDIPKVFISFLISILIIISGWYQKSEIARKHREHIRFNPLYEGKSWIFQFFFWVTSLIDPRHAKVFFTETETRSNVVKIEFFFLIVLAIILEHNFFEEQGISSFSWFLIIGAISLVLEDKALTRAERRNIEARMATEFRAELLEAAYQKFKKNSVNQMATVSYVKKSERITQKQKPVNHLRNTATVRFR